MRRLRHPRRIEWKHLIGLAIIAVCRLWMRPQIQQLPARHRGARHYRFPDSDHRAEVAVVATSPQSVWLIPLEPVCRLPPRPIPSRREVRSPVEGQVSADELECRKHAGPSSGFPALTVLMHIEGDRCTIDRLKVTSAQIRAGRALLNWTVRDLADRAGVHRNTITRSETDATGPGHATGAIQRALESAGVIFVNENGDGPGVRLRKPSPESADGLSR